MNSRKKRLTLAVVILLLTHSFALNFFEKSKPTLVAPVQNQDKGILSNTFQIQLVKQEKSKDKPKPKKKLKKSDLAPKQEEVKKIVESKNKINQIQQRISKAVVESFQLRVLRLIENYKYYPIREQRRGIEGRTTIGFLLYKNGHIEKLQVLRSSGVRALDEAALNAVKSVGIFPEFPDDILDDSLVFNVHLDFIL